MKTKKLYQYLVPALSFLAFNTAHAAAFQSFEQSAVLMGQANAGTTVTDDPSIAFYNPAAMVFVKKPEIGVSAIAVTASINYTPFLATDHGGQLVTGNYNDAGTTNYVPGLYLVAPINDVIAFGFSAAVPFGLSTNYDNNSVARYFATESKIQTINLNPSIGIKINDRFGIGFGLDELYTKANLNQAFDLQTIVTPVLQQGDTFIKNSASGWQLGWNAGLYFQYSPRTKFGLGYHSRIKANIKGQTNINHVTNPFFTTFLTGLTSSDVETGLNLPDYLTFSAQQDVTQKWSLMTDIEYIDWSVLKNITLNYSQSPNTTYFSTQPFRSPTVLPEDYRNTWRIALGQRYQFANNFDAKMGLAYDESPVRSQYRDARLPDTDRIWLTTGFDYDITKNLTVSADYAHIFFANTSVNNTSNIVLPPVGPLPAVVLTANYNAAYMASANLYGVQLNYRFG